MMIAEVCRHVRGGSRRRLVAARLRAARQFDRLVEPARQPLEQNVFFDRQRFAVDFAIDRGVALEPDVMAVNGAFERALNGDLVRGDIALDARALANDDLNRLNIADQAPEDLGRAFAYDIAGNKHAGTER